MTPEEKELLHRSVALSEENNDMLKSLRRHARMARLMTFIYWIAIIGAGVGAYYYFQPYIQKVSSIYDTVKSDFNSFSATVNKLNPIK